MSIIKYPFSLDKHHYQGLNYEQFKSHKEFTLRCGNYLPAVIPEYPEVVAFKSLENPDVTYYLVKEKIGI